MTPYQKYQQRLFAEILHTLDCIANGTDIAAGTLRQDLRQLLTEYATADFIITRCECLNGCIIPNKDIHLLRDTCAMCEKPIERLRADGTWQTQAQRDKLNLARLEEAR